MLLNGAFTVLLLVLFIRVCRGFVPPPTNVTVSCQNLKAIVSWDYDRQLPETDFRVIIRASTTTKIYKDYTTDHVYDLSDFVWTSKDHYLAFLFVTVTARQGGNESEAVTSKTFSFNNLKAVDVKCALEFPRVDLNVDETRTSVTFENPLKIYRQLTKAGEPNDAWFLRFTVSSAASDFKGSCEVGEDLCRMDVTFPEGVEKCIRLRGDLFSGNSIYQMSFRETDLICYSEPTAPSDGGASLLAIILVSLFVAVIFVVIFIICKVKAWTMKTPNPPSSLLVPPVNDSKVAPLEDKAEMSPVFVSSVRPKDNVYSKNLQAGSDSNPCDRRVQLEGSQRELEAVGLMSEGHATDEESADDSLKTECVSLSSQDEEQESLSPYDSPHFVTMDMGDGDMVTGYSAK